MKLARRWERLCGVAGVVSLLQRAPRLVLLMPGCVCLSRHPFVRWLECLAVSGRAKAGVVLFREGERGVVSVHFSVCSLAGVSSVLASFKKKKKCSPHTHTRRTLLTANFLFFFLPVKASQTADK